MPNERSDQPSLFNPFTLWTDLGMRAAEMAVASTQNLTEGADRVTRAVAGTEAEEIVNQAPDSGAGAGGWPAANLASFAEMQRAAWDLMAQSWLRWMSTANSLMSASAGQGLAPRARTTMVAPERALAADEPRPRRRPAAKSRKAQRASRSR
jgi:hypothetical protein